MDRFYNAYDVNMWEKNFGESTAYSCRTNLFAEFQHSFSKVILNQLNLWLFINCYGKVGEKKSLPTVSNFCHKTVYFTEQEPTKHPIRTEYPIKQKPRDALARKKESTERSPRRGR